jgi:hypothetical protein
MPEQLTKHPEVTLQVLKSGGARCGEGAPQTILSTCPAERFCALPGGEICVYGLPDAAAMTQLEPADWQALAARTTTTAVPAAPSAETAPLAQAWGAGLPAGLALGVLLGLLAAWAMQRLRQRGRSPP